MSFHLFRPTVSARRGRRPLLPLAGWIALTVVIGASAGGLKAVPSAAETAAPGEAAADADADPLTGGLRSGHGRLGAGDELRIQVVEGDAVTERRTRIDAEGFIRLPLTGRVRAAGSTSRELEVELTRRLEEYVFEPAVLVEQVGFRSRPVSVLGAVNKPGVYQIEGRKSLIELLSQAGGLRGDAGDTVKISRRTEWGLIPLPSARPGGGGDFSVAEVSIERVMRAENPGENIWMQPYDVVSVPRAEMVYVVGEVRRAGGFVLTEQSSISLLQALALAGGVGETAARKHAKILRASEQAAERAEIAVDLAAVMSGRSPDWDLRAGDILFVPRSGGKAAARKAAAAALRVATGVIIWRR